MRYHYFYRLSALQESGEAGWKRRLVKPDEKLQQLMGEVKLRDKAGRTGERPLSLAERLSWLEGAQEGWKHRVEEKDVHQFTVEGRMARTGKKELNFSCTLKLLKVL